MDEKCSRRMYHVCNAMLCYAMLCEAMVHLSQQYLTRLIIFIPLSIILMGLPVADSR